MNKPLSLLTLVFLVMGGTQTTNAQTDSLLNLGNQILSVNATPHLTVKGEDLERMPFSSLEQGLQAYFHGAFTNPELITYVIDGNLAADINGYSVFDIESVTLVQNAASLLNNAASNPSQLLLIKTRTGRQRPAGLTAAASFYPGRFGQVYLSGSTGGRVRAGASVELHREVEGDKNGPTVISYDAPNLSRLRAAAWMNANLGRHSELTLRINTSPQRWTFTQEKGSEYNANLQLAHEKETNRSFAASARIVSKISSKWTNEFNAAYSDIRRNEDLLKQQYMASTMFTSLTNTNQVVERDKYQVRNQMVFTTKAGSWVLRPSLNLAYLYFPDETKQITISKISLADSSEITGRSGSATKIGWRSAFISPALDLQYKDIINLQGGLQWGLIKGSPVYGNQNGIFPFVSISVDVLHAAQPDAHLSMKIFASYAEGKSAHDREYLLSPEERFDLTYSSPVLGSMVNLDKKSTILSFGGTFSSRNSPVVLSYVFNDYSYYLTSYLPLPVVTGFAYYLGELAIDLQTHRIALGYHTPEKSPVSYRGGIHVTAVSGRHTHETPGVNIDYEDLRYYPRKGWSGGWTNHFRINKWTTGFNAVCFYNEQRVVSNPTAPGSELKEFNSIALQHVYLGYLFNTRQMNFEVYASGRNLFKSRETGIPHTEFTYVGVGVRTGFRK